MKKSLHSKRRELNKVILRAVSYIVLHRCRLICNQHYAPYEHIYIYIYICICNSVVGCSTISTFRQERTNKARQMTQKFKKIRSTQMYQAVYMHTRGSAYKLLTSTSTFFRSTCEIDLTC